MRNSESSHFSKKILNIVKYKVKTQNVESIVILIVERFIKINRKSLEPRF
jgi:hypothetical protein